MNYTSIINEDFNNGEGVGVSLFVQGCHFHCKGCFNSETWDFNGGHVWTNEVEDEFLKLMDKPYITRTSILGGEPLANENVKDVLELIKKIKHQYPNKKLWLYTGYTLEAIMNPVVTDDFNPERDNILHFRREVLNYIDILVDGKYVDELRDLTLKFRGSSNQRLIDIKKTLEQGEIILWTK